VVQGLDKFVEYFKDFKNDYVVIGGLATAMVMNQLDFTFRATKDIDLVVISNDNEEFLKRLLSFIELAGYSTKQRTNNDIKHNLFRFFGSEDKSYPEQIELFAIHKEDSTIINNSHIIPIETPGFYDYLSAILLDKDYYTLLIENTIEIDGLNVASAEVLIPLKIHAHLNLINGKANYDGKHLRDVIRLCTVLDGENNISLYGEPKKDFLKFIPIFEEIEEDKVKTILKSMQINNVSKNELFSIFKLSYKI
jgi:hypothetical protein